jgi:adenylate cyclase
MPGTIVRKLTTILAADVEGYSRLMAADEVATLRALRACRAVFGRLIERHGGRIVNTAGDGLLADFPSVVEAVLCAVEVQRELAAQNGAAAAASAMRYRIGIHLGDVMVDGGDLFGEGVNLAARLQSLADPGGILISEPVYQQVRSKVAIGFSYLGERRPKNFPEDVPVYGLVLDGETETPPPPRRPGPPPPAPSTTPLAGHWRRALQYGVIVLSLLAVDLGTGDGCWVQWQALGMARAFGLEAAPLLAADRLTGQLLRAAVIGLGLAAINALSWSGYPWALWPIGAITVLILLRAVSRGRDKASP